MKNEKCGDKNEKSKIQSVGVTENEKEREARLKRIILVVFLSRLSPLKKATSQRHILKSKVLLIIVVANL
ncbi:MAG: hypothetical protein ACI8RD_005159 [Bacillariaceae sp.]|jgi:hypothetical protein